MKTGNHRDRLLDKQLRRSLQARQAEPDAESCLDAETLAAWVDGGLDATAAAMAEAHVSTCARCQAMVGVMANLIQDREPGAGSREPEAASREPGPWFRRYWAGWLVPLAAGVAAVTLWMVAPLDRTLPPRAVEPQPAQARADAPPTAAEAPAPPVLQAEPKRREQALKDQFKEQKPDALAKEARDEVSLDAAKNTDSKLEDRQAADRLRAAERPAAAPPPAPSAMGAPASPALGRMAAKAEAPPREIASPEPAVRWRLLDNGNVERTVDAGANWEATPTSVTVPLTAGSSPSSDVCWMVGRGGTIVITTDGRRWQRVPFPEGSDLVAVQATDRLTAVVTTSDGRAFRTADGGASWSR